MWRVTVAIVGVFWRRVEVRWLSYLLSVMGLLWLFSWSFYHYGPAVYSCGGYAYYYRFRNEFDPCQDNSRLYWPLYLLFDVIYFGFLACLFVVPVVFIVGAFVYGLVIIWVDHIGPALRTWWQTRTNLWVDLEMAIAKARN